MTQPVVFGTQRTLAEVPARRRSRAPVVALLVLLAAAACLGPALARADEGDAPRYEPTSRGAAVERWRGEVEQYAWSSETALAVIRCESLGDPGAVNPTSGAQGLFQVMPDLWQRLANTIHGAWVSLLDGSVNVRTAYALYEAFGGWSPWASSRGCWGGL